MSEWTKDEWETFAQFLAAAHDVCEKPDTVYTFDCPVCGSKAKVVKSSYNGHHRGACEGCGLSFIE